jgi:hypothetical protein
MDTHSQHSDDLNELERRLSAWQPTSAGLNPDAMLFAAGRAAARHGSAHLLWPALTAGTTLLAVVLAVGLFAERNERLALAQQLRQQTPTTVSIPAPPPPVVPTESPAADEPSPNSYLASHRALETGLEDWPARVLVRVETPVSPSPPPPVLQVGQRNTLLDP